MADGLDVVAIRILHEPAVVVGMVFWPEAGLAIVLATGGQSGGIECPPKDATALWLAEGESRVPVHIAFAAKDRAAVRAFYAAALPAGGKDNGEPGLRPKYHANYYGGFVKDPDGNNIEAVCHQEE